MTISSRATIDSPELEAIRNNQRRVIVLFQNISQDYRDFTDLLKELFPKKQKFYLLMENKQGKIFRRLHQHIETSFPKNKLKKIARSSYWTSDRRQYIKNLFEVLENGEVLLMGVSRLEQETIKNHLLRDEVIKRDIGTIQLITSSLDLKI